MRHPQRHADVVAGERLLDDPNDLARYSAWELDFRQLDPGPMQCRVRVRATPHLSLLTLSVDRAVQQVGSSPPGFITFGFPMRAPLRSWAGAPVEGDVVVNFGSRREFDGASHPDFVGFTLGMSTAWLWRVADRLGLALPWDAAAPVRRQTPALAGLAERGDALIREPALPLLAHREEDLAAALLDALADAPEYADRSGPGLRARAVNRAVDLIEERLADALSVAEICAASGASWRTLSRGFRERFGIGPKAYVNRLRLLRVRQELLQGPSAGTVGDAANAWGFWHMGQFARDYRRMFGELPSQSHGSAR